MAGMVHETRRGETYRFFVVGVGASAVAPDVVHADDDGEHGEEGGA